jgi:cytosine/adenosine deaminase-related metal-dependent hydrolase
MREGRAAGSDLRKKILLCHWSLTMTKKIQKARWIVQGVRDRHTLDMIDDGAILHEDGVILEVGPAAGILARFPDAAVSGSDAQIVLPGFVNAHHHVGLTPLQLGSPDHALELWFASRLSARPLDRYLDTLYSAFEMIASGVTTVQHIHGWSPGPVETIFGEAQKILQAYRDIGMRASYSYAVRVQNRFVYESDETLLAKLPAHLAARMGPILRAQQFPFADNLRLFDMLVAENEGQSLTKIQLAPANLHWCDDEALADLEDRSARHDIPMHMHLLETAYQREYARRRTGTTAVKHLAKLGLLSPRLTLGHAVWLSEEDIELVAAHGVCVCHNCSSNFRLRSGVAPLNEFAARGVTVAVGIDEAGLNDDRDMLQEMRLILNVHRSPGMDDRPPTCAQVLRMATEHGAMTTPFGAGIGRLEVGRSADFVVINHERALFPFQDPQIGIVEAIMQRAKTAAVDATVIAGVTVYEDGVFTLIDRDATLREIAAIFARPRSAGEAEMVGFSREMQNFVRNFYDGYFDGAPGRPR